MKEPTDTASPARHAGVHYMAEFWGAREIDGPGELESLLHGAARAGHATIMREAIHAYTPQGITGFVLLADSHLSLHTWPELDYVAVDIFTCGRDASGREALAYLEQALEPERVEIHRVLRGELG